MMSLEPTIELSDTPGEADAEFLGADEPRVVRVRGIGPRWGGTAYADPR